MSKFKQYDKNNTYLENYNYAREQREKRFNEEREEIQRDKLELDKIQNQLDLENQLEKQKKALLKKQQFEEYSNYLKQRDLILEKRNNPNIKLNGEDRIIQKHNYNEQMDNLCLNPTRQANIKPKEQFVNFSQAGRNYQRGYSHGYNILTGEIFSSPNLDMNKANIVQQPLPNQEKENFSQKMEYENESKNMIIKQKEVESNQKKDENNYNSPNNSNNFKEEEYITYMEMLRQKENEQNNNKIYNQKNDDITYPEYKDQFMDYDKNLIMKNEPENKIAPYEELLNKPKPSYHNAQPLEKENEIKNDLSQLNRPNSQNIEKRYPHHILDSSKNEYLLNKQKNMMSNYDIFKGKNYFQTQYQNNQIHNENNPKYGKLEKQREYAKVLEGQINSKRIYEETIRNLSKNSEPERERYQNNNMMVFGGMNPYQKIKDRNNKLNDIPNDPYSNKNYNINTNSFLSSNPITNPGGNYQNNNVRRKISGRFQNNGNIIIGK